MSHRAVDERPAHEVTHVPLPSWWVRVVRGLIGVLCAYLVWFAWAASDVRFLMGAALLGGAAAVSFRRPAVLVHALAVLVFFGVFVFVAWLVTSNT